MSATVSEVSYLDDLVNAVRLGHCILFLGAGINAPPPDNSPYAYPPEERPPLGGRLAEVLADKCRYRELFGLDENAPLDLQRVSLCYETNPMLGRKALVDELSTILVKGKKPSPALKMLAELPFPIFVTTNYDLLLESALRRCTTEKEPKVITYNPDKDDTHEPTPDPLEDPTAQNPIVFKMHGDFSDEASIVITDEDYITFVMRMTEKEEFHPIPATVRFRMQKWPTLFVGYSLLDYNLRLLFRTLRWRIDKSKIPVAFSVDKQPDRLIQQVYESERRLVAFVTEDIWKFVPWLYEQVKGEEYCHE